MLLALDINTNRVGWAFGGPADGGPRCGVWHLSGGETGDDLKRSAAGLYNSISELSKLIRPEIIYVEAPFNPNPKKGGVSNAHVVFVSTALYGAAVAASANTRARVRDAHVQSWRKTFTGMGRPENPKQVTMARCAQLGWVVKNDDEGDACGIWCHGMLLSYPRWSFKPAALFAPRKAVA